MTSVAIKSDDPLVNAVRAALKKIEPRKMPTETMHNTSIWNHALGWKCPYCGGYCRRDDRTRYRRHSQETIIDYSGYNIHFAHHHATLFYKEQLIIDVVKKHLEKVVV